MDRSSSLKTIQGYNPNGIKYRFTCNGLLFLKGIFFFLNVVHLKVSVIISRTSWEPLWKHMYVRSKHAVTCVICSSLSFSQKRSLTRLLPSHSCANTVMSCATFKPPSLPHTRVLFQLWALLCPRNYYFLIKTNRFTTFCYVKVTIRLFGNFFACLHHLFLLLSTTVYCFFYS